MTRVYEITCIRYFPSLKFGIPNKIKALGRTKQITLVKYKQLAIVHLILLSPYYSLIITQLHFRRVKTAIS